jgi:hypothetical protein
VPRRLTKWLRRLAITILVLAALGLAAFTWVFYWPLEGKQDKVEDLVPESADFLLKTTWAELRDTGFLQKNLRDEPLFPALRDAWRKQVQPGLDEIASIEAQVNQQIPFGLSRLDVESDIFPGEMVFAGRFCRERGPPNPPTWREFMVLFRTSWKGKLFAGLQREFVRNLVAQNAPGLKVDASEDEDIFRFVLSNVRVSDARSRAGCGDGFVMPPENLYYGARIRDVLVFSNSENLIAKAVDLGRGVGGAPFSRRPDFHLDAPSGSVAAAVDLGQLHLYLRRFIDLGGRGTAAVKDFFSVEGLDRLNGHLHLASPDLLAGRASVRLRKGGLREPVQENYRQPPLDLRGGLASFFPSEDTFLFAQLRTEPFHLLDAIHRDVLTDQERQLWQDNVLKNGLYTSTEAFLKDVSQHLSDSVGIAVGRLGGLYDNAQFPTFDSESRDVPPNPAGALAFVIPLRKGAVQAEVDDFLAHHVHLMGFSSDLERVPYREFTYTRLKFEQVQDAADFRLVRPAYLLVQDRLVFASHEEYFKKILDVYSDAVAHPPLSKDPSFQTAMNALPDKGHIAVWADLEKLTRVPPKPAAPGESDPTGGPRGLLWDRRQEWVQNAKDPRAKAIEIRGEIHRGRFGGRPLTPEEDLRVEDEVAERKEAWKSRYPEFLEEYRRELLGYRRARAFGLVVRANSDEVLQLEMALLFRPADEP